MIKKIQILTVLILMIALLPFKVLPKIYLQKEILTYVKN